MYAPRFSALLVALVALVCLVITGATATAGELTYCVGGVTKTFVISRHACWRYQEPIGHFHTYVTDGRKCYECFDLKDNTCDDAFLEASKWSSTFHRANGYFDCPVWAGADELLAEVKDGTVVAEQATAPPPPPPTKQVQLRQETFVPAGPYGPGDTIRVRTRVVDDHGAVRSGGATEIVLKGPGGEIKAQAKGGTDGFLEAELKLPDEAGAYNVHVESTGVQLASDEALAGGKAPSTDAALQVQACLRRTRVTSPGAGQTLVGGGTVALEGGLLDDHGQPIALEDGLRFEVELDGKLLPAVNATANGARATGAVRLPQVQGQVPVRVRLVGSKAGTCGGEEVVATASDVGVSIDASKWPRKCYVGRPCELPIRLRLPDDAALAGPGRAFLADPALSNAILLNSEAQPAAVRSGSDTFSASFVPTNPNDSTVEVRFTATGRTVSLTRPLTVRWPLDLKAPGALEYGELNAGDAADRHCLKLDFAGSKGAEDQPLRLSVTMPPDCEADAMIDLGERFASLGGKGVVFEPGLALSRNVCLKPPRCQGVSATQAMLRIVPEDADFAATQSRTVSLGFAVKSRPWWSCQLWWMGIVGLGLGISFIAAGVLWPKRFRLGDSIVVSTKPEKLLSAPRRNLRQQPGGRAGFYRSASAGLRNDGSPVRGHRGAIITFVPHEAGVSIVMRGATLQRQDPRTKKLEPVRNQGGPILLSPSVTYEAGGLYFQLA